MNTHTVGSRLVSAVALSLAVHVVPVQAQGPNLLVDPGFENNPLESAHNVLNYFEQYQGFWGPENGSIVGQVGPVIPPEGTKMLQMRDDGGVTTAAYQVTDLIAYAALIDAGQATLTLSSVFNADPSVATPRGNVVCFFYAVPDFYSARTYISDSRLLDADPRTWEQATVSGRIPVGTRWILSEASFSNDWMQGLPGYADSTEVTITGGGGGFDLQVSASCPDGGPIRVSWTRATPGGWVVLLNALNEGTVTIPRSAPCAGTVLGLGSRGIRTVWHGPAGSNGSGSIMDTAGPRDCGTYLQLLDLGTCSASNVAAIQ